MCAPSPPTAHSLPSPAASKTSHGQSWRSGALNVTLALSGSILAIRFGKPYAAQTAVRVVTMLPTFCGWPVGDSEGTPGSRIGGEEVRKRGLTLRTVGEPTSPTQIEPKPIVKLP